MGDKTLQGKEESSPVAVTLLPKDPRRILNINVGVLGHVDSGKTSLVKTLSTLLSTASLDKNPQSRERGITLDLGFSAFLIHELPPQVPRTKYDCLQVTLVDCPGHSSLIRTIIGGAQIIDMVLLVIDATKGIQTQTAECLVISEITTDNLIVVLNKIDLFPPAEREQRIQQVQTRIRKALQSTKFQDVPMVAISAAVGGEKVAALTSSTPLQSNSIEGLIQLLKSQIKLPHRAYQNANFYFAIDHCFPIKGKGTVITGTVLSGCAKVNDTVQFPEHGIDRKIKSIQMFKRQVPEAMQGDRCGICLASLDSNLIERGVAATPGTVSFIESAICIVKKVRFFKGKLVTDSKFHISVGHRTVMATVKFFGAKELAERLAREGSSSGIQNGEECNDRVQQDSVGIVVAARSACQSTFVGSSSLSGESISGLPRLPFDFDQDFLHQDQMIEDLSSNDCIDDETYGEEVEGLMNHKHLTPSSPSPKEAPLHWAVVNFQTPVYCPLNSLVIGSRLDTDVQANTCRLAFSGRIIQKFDPKLDMARFKIYTWKEKRGIIHRLGDPHLRNVDNQVVRYEVYGCDLFKKETNMNQFVGLKVETETGDLGIIRSSFGTEGKFKVHFPAGTEAKEGSGLILRFKRYSNDPKKGMHQDLILPEALPGRKIEPVKKGKKQKSKQLNGTSRLEPSSTEPAEESVKESLSKLSIVANGEISRYKQDSRLENGKYGVAIVEGFFTPEINIKEKIGMKVVVVDAKEEGVVSGSFGKLGKCKVSFDGGLSSPEGSKVHLVG